MPLYLTWSLVALAGIVVAVGVYFLIRYLRYRNGSLGKSLVTGALKKYGIIRNYKILDDVHLTVGGREAHIDHMLIGFFGILFVSTVNDTAEYYGEIKGAQWTKVAPKKRSTMENLIQKNVHNIDVVREIFSKNGVYNIKMDGIVVFCGREKKTLIGISGAQGLMMYKPFKAYIKKSKFEKDNDVDVPALYEIILKYRT